MKITIIDNNDILILYKHDKLLDIFKVTEIYKVVHNTVEDLWTLTFVIHSVDPRMTGKDVHGNHHNLEYVDFLRAINGIIPESLNDTYRMEHYKGSSI